MLLAVCVMLYWLAMCRYVVLVGVCGNVVLVSYVSLCCIGCSMLLALYWLLFGVSVVLLVVYG